MSYLVIIQEKQPTEQIMPIAYRGFNRMRVYTPLYMPLFKVLAFLLRPLFHSSVREHNNKPQNYIKSIIVLDELGPIEFFILLNHADLKPVFIEEESMVTRYRFLFKRTNISESMTLIVSLASLRIKNFRSIHQYTFLAYAIRKLRRRIIPISMVRNYDIGTLRILPQLFKKMLVCREINFLQSRDVYYKSSNKLKCREMSACAIYNTYSELRYIATYAHHSIFDAFVKAAKIYGLSHEILEDPLLGTLNYRKMLISIRVLASKLYNLNFSGQSIGLLMPNACGTAIAFYAIISLGKTPAMINFTSGIFNIKNSCKAADIKEIITSKAFIRKSNLDALIEGLGADYSIYYLEDILKSVDIFDKIRAYLFMFYPIKQVLAEDIAAILFTSGSEGKPKGVSLSHKNILSNSAQTASRIHFDQTDIVLNILPVFHCFGLNIGLILPMISGVKVYLYPTPLHYKIIPELIHKIQATIFFGTDTFLSSYAKFSSAEQYKSIRYVVSGAERLKENTKDIWKDKFNINILEGYGITEASPVISLSSPAFNKARSAGLLLPNIEFSLSKIEGIKNGGRLNVCGPNIMLGYLHSDKPGIVCSTMNGWHDTGDIVEIDDAGYITIIGREKRFAKIGGEMISLAAIDGLASELWPDIQSVSIAIDDPRKGQSIIILTQKRDSSLSELRKYIKETGLSDLYVPSKLVIVDEFPLLGSGKIDYTKVSESLSSPSFG